MLGRALDLRSSSRILCTRRHLDSHRFCKSPLGRRLDVRASKAKRNYGKPVSSSKPNTAKPEVTAVPTPPRIDSTSNIPVRKQQYYAKLKKAYAAAATTSSVPRKQTFRKQKLDPEQRAEEARKQERAEQIAQAEFKKSPLQSLRNLYGVEGTECPPVLLVDGYNVLHMYTDFMRVSQPDHPVVTETALEAQREFLEEALSIYSQRRGIKVVVVYDALNAVSDSVYIHIRTSTRRAGVGQIDIVFCSDQSADLWIVKEVETLKKEDKHPHIVVATDDNEIVSSARFKGGFPIPCSHIIDEMQQAEREVNNLLSEPAHVYRIVDADAIRAGLTGRRLFRQHRTKKNAFDNALLHSLRQQKMELKQGSKVSANQALQGPADGMDGMAAASGDQNLTVQADTELEIPADKMRKSSAEQL